MDHVRFLKMIKHTADAYGACIDRAAKSCGLTRAEADVMLFFHNHPEHDSAMDAVRLRGFSKAYVSRALLALEKKSFVSIRTDQADRRVRHIAIRSEAQAAAQALSRAQGGFVEELTQRLSAGERQTFFELLDKIMQSEGEPYETSRP